MARRKRVISAEESSTIASQIRAIRKKKGITQYELADKLGVTQRVISYYENARTNLSVDVIQKIAKALSVSQKKLFEYDSNPETEPEVSPALQKKLNLVAKMPYADQQYVVKTIEMIAQKNGLNKS